MTDLQKRLLEYSTSEAWKAKFGSEIAEAELLWANGDLQGCSMVLDRLPTKDSLLSDLLKVLEGKRVHKTLLIIFEKKKNVGRFIKLKAMSSLFTHAVIECEQGRLEFEILLPQILENITKLTYES